MKNILSLLILLVLGCKNDKITSSKDSVSKNLETTDYKVAANSMFDGGWRFESMNNKDSLQNKTFEINLYSNKNKTLLGNYCSVSRNGNKIDCFEDDEPNISGEVKNDTLYINFKSSWENSNGEAKLYFTQKNKLYWKIIKSEGELYLPDGVELTKSN